MNDENDAGGKTGQSHGAATEHDGDELGEASRSLALKRELAIKALSRQAKESLIRVAGLTTMRVKSK
jgi:hypothetical protein